MDAISGSIPIHYTCNINGSPHNVVAEVDNNGNVSSARLISNASIGLPNSHDFLGTGNNFRGPELPAGGQIVSRAKLRPNSIYGGTALNSYRIVDTNGTPIYRLICYGASLGFYAPDAQGGPTTDEYKNYGLSAPVCGYSYDGMTPRPVCMSFIDYAPFQGVYSNVPNSAGVAPNYTDNFPMRRIARQTQNTPVNQNMSSSGKYTGFRYLSHVDGRGPLFEGKFKLTSNTSNSAAIPGLWAYDPSIHQVVTLIQPGDVFPCMINFVVQSFKCLEPVPCSVGQRRAWNYIGPSAAPRPVIMNVTFTNGYKGIATVSY